MSGVIWSVLLVITLRSALQLHNVSAYEQGTAIGVLLIASLLLSNIAHTVSRAVEARRARRRPAVGSPSLVRAHG
jgi:rhamnose transport system permease protein